MSTQKRSGVGISIAVAMVVAIGLLWFLMVPRAQDGAGPRSGAEPSDGQSKATLAPLPGERSVPEHEDKVPTLPSGESSPSMLACLRLEDPQQRAQCVDDLFEQWGDSAADRLGEEVCQSLSENGDGPLARAMIQAAAEQWQSGDLVGTLDRVYAACSSFIVSDAIVGVVLGLAKADYLLMEALHAELLSGSIFLPDRSELGVILAAELGLHLDDDAFRAHLEAGATGEHGASAAQAHYAALCVVRMIDEPEGILAMVHAITLSPDLPREVEDGPMGSSLMHVLMVPHLRPAVSEAEFLEAINAVLNHPLVGPSAAAHVLEQQEAPPSGVAKESWVPVVDLSKAIVRSVTR